MMKMKIRLGLLFLLVIQGVCGQEEGLTSSPYSLYGLGVINQTSIGRYNGMGYSGIALKSTSDINNLNPANYALAPRNSFFYDVGIRGAYNNYSNTSDNESQLNFNFSNLAFAFAVADGIGMGITMIPYSDVGYSLLGIQTNIEGSNETFESNVTGLGGLNDLRWNTGISLAKWLRFGASASFLFGNIEETESFVIDDSGFSLEEQTNYSGLRFGLGMQLDISDRITVGSTLQFPTTLSGNLVRSALKSMDGTDSTVEDNVEDDADDFELPMELGFGISVKPLDGLTVNADYKKNFWTATEQTENIGDYLDQDIYAFGLEYLKNPRGIKYWERMAFRAGFNFDNGYLAINNEKVDGYAFTLGLGLPAGKGGNSKFNLSYSYGVTGQVQNVLIQENYHLFTLNFSLENLWFVKRKVN